jgi:sulfhydrogenase subunit gamma (sulfur reductase)
VSATVPGLDLDQPTDMTAAGVTATENLYLPELTEVLAVRQETSDVKSVQVRFLDEQRQKDFRFRVGQFGIWSRFGSGESTFNLCGSSTWTDRLEFCFRRVGRVTDAFWGIQPGDTIGFRGPYGNSYPTEEWEGRNLLFVAGGIAMPPVRCAIWYCLENREKFGDIHIVYGARTVDDLVFARELDEWATHPRTTVTKTVDPGGETPGWDGQVGFVPTVLGQAEFPTENTVALVIGPPIMIKYGLDVLSKRGFSTDDIYTSLENRMKCGVGKCGRCNVGSAYVCTDGPVFSLSQVQQLPPDF